MSTRKRHIAKEDAEVEARSVVPFGAQNVVVVPQAEWDAMLEHIEDLYDALRVEEIKKQSDSLRSDVPSEVASRIVAGTTPLQAWREHAGLTVHDLAIRSEVPAKTIQQVEAGGQFNFDDMSKLARALGCSFLAL